MSTSTFWFFSKNIGFYKVFVFKGLELYQLTPRLTRCGWVYWCICEPYLFVT